MFKILYFEVKLCKRFGPGKGKQDTLPRAIFYQEINSPLEDFCFVVKVTICRSTNMYDSIS